MLIVTTQGGNDQDEDDDDDDEMPRKRKRPAARQLLSQDSDDDQDEVAVAHLFTLLHYVALCLQSLRCNTCQLYTTASECYLHMQLCCVKHACAIL